MEYPGYEYIEGDTEDHEKHIQGMELYYSQRIGSATITIMSDRVTDMVYIFCNEPSGGGGMAMTPMIDRAGKPLTRDAYEQQLEARKYGVETAGRLAVGDVGDMDAERAS